MGEEEAAAARSRGVLGGVATLLSDPEVATFFLLCMLMGVGHGVLGSYLFLYLKHLGK